MNGLTEDQVRKIVRDEMDRQRAEDRERMLTQAPMPMPVYQYQRPYYPGGPWPVTCGRDANTTA